MLRSDAVQGTASQETVDGGEEVFQVRTRMHIHAQKHKHTLPHTLAH